MVTKLDLLKITDQNQENLHRALESILNEHLMLTQMYSFEGSEKDLRQVAEYSSTCLEHLTNILIGNVSYQWGWEEYQKARAEFAEKPTPQDKEKLIREVIFNVGLYESSLHTGEKWCLVEDNKGYLKFKPTYPDKVHIRFDTLKTLSNSYPFIEDILYNQGHLYIQYNEIKNDA